MNDTIKDLLDRIEQARCSGALNNDAARTASVALGLTGDDAMLACRLLAQGADPASIEYLATGEISPAIRTAHAAGPGALEGEEQGRWLLLAALSVDESRESTLLERVRGLGRAVETLLNMSDEEGRALIKGKLKEIRALDFEMHLVGGREMRVYSADLGFAAAYWEGKPCAAVRGVFDGKPYLAVGSNKIPLVDLGVSVDKVLSPFFGIVNL